MGGRVCNMESPHLFFPRSSGCFQNLCTNPAGTFYNKVIPRSSIKWSRFSNQEVAKTELELGFLLLSFLFPMPQNWRSLGRSCIRPPASLVSELAVFGKESIVHLVFYLYSQEACNLLIINHSTLAGVFAFSIRSKLWVKVWFWPLAAH